jgi:hypothetical protein
MKPMMRISPILGAALLALACTPASPTASTASPSLPPESAAPAAVAAAYRQVAADQLTVAASRAGDEPDAALTPGTVSAGQAVWVLETAGGWHLVVAEGPRDELTIPFGWVPAQVDGADTLEPVGISCPASPMPVAQLVGLGMFGGLACYGSEPIAVDGFTPVACGIGGSPRTGTPDWLNGTWSGTTIGDREPAPPDYEVEGFLHARAAPGSASLGGCGDPGWRRFLGHFDDPASQTCRTETADATGVMHVVDPRLSELLCRSELVLTDALPIGQP